MKPYLISAVALLVLGVQSSFAADVVNISAEGNLIKIETGKTTVVAPSIAYDPAADTLTFTGTNGSLVRISTPESQFMAEHFQFYLKAWRATFEKAENPIAPFKVGDTIRLRLTGEAATEYARHTGNDAGPGYCLETSATIAKKFGDGRVRIEYSTHFPHENSPEQLLTLVAIVDSSEINAEDATTNRLELSQFKGLKLRTWTIAKESGD